MEYFAKIAEPKKLRLSMMQSARESIILISLLEEIEALRILKLELIESVKEDFKSAGELCKEISNLLGDEKVREEIINSYKMTERGEEAKAKVVVTPKIKVDGKFKGELLPKVDVKAKTEVDRLEYTLKQIEDRIAQLAR